MSALTGVSGWVQGPAENDCHRLRHWINTKDNTVSVDLHVFMTRKNRLFFRLKEKNTHWTLRTTAHPTSLFFVLFRDGTALLLRRGNFLHIGTPLNPQLTTSLWFTFPLWVANVDWFVSGEGKVWNNRVMQGNNTCTRKVLCWHMWGKALGYWSNNTRQMQNVCRFKILEWRNPTWIIHEYKDTLRRMKESVSGVTEQGVTHLHVMHFYVLWHTRVLWCSLLQICTLMCTCCSLVQLLWSTLIRPCTLLHLMQTHALVYYDPKMYSGALSTLTEGARVYTTRPK